MGHPQLWKAGPPAQHPLNLPSPTARDLVMVAVLFVGNRHSITHPNAVAFEFPVVFSRAYGSAARPMFVAIEQRAFTVDDNIDACVVGMGPPSCNTIHTSPNHPTACVVPVIAGLCKIFRVHHLYHLERLDGVARICSAPL